MMGIKSRHVEPNSSTEHSAILINKYTFQKTVNC